MRISKPVRAFLMAGAMIVIMPLIVVFLFFQRKFISGVTEGAVK